MTIGDLWEIIPTFEISGKKCNNMYYYRQFAVDPVAGVLAAQAAADAWQTQILTPILPITNPSVRYKQIQVKNLFNPSQSYTKLIDVPGTTAAASNEFFSSALSLGLRLGHNNPAIRVGGRRMGGQVEGMAGNNGLWSLGGLLTALTNAMKGDLVTGILPWLAPIVVQRVFDAITQKYNLPANQGEFVYGVINAITNNVLATTQTSRKNWR